MKTEYVEYKSNIANFPSDDITFPIAKFPFISSIIPASPAGVYISQLIPYNRACAEYSDFLDSAQLLTQKLLKQGYVTPWLKSSLQKFHGGHHVLVDRNVNGSLPFYIYLLFLYHLPKGLTLPDHMSSSPVFSGVRVSFQCSSL